MKPVKFEYSISNQKTGSLVDKGTFTSDKPYYEISKILSELDVSKGNLIVDFEDEYSNVSLQYFVNLFNVYQNLNFAQPSLIIIFHYDI